MSEFIEYRKFLRPFLQLRPDALERFEEIIATGNIGCWAQIAAASTSSPW